MITGETEQLLKDYPYEPEYDEFFGRKKRRRARRARRKARRAKRRSQPKRIKRRRKRKQFFKDVGQIYRDVGGATAIGNAIDAITKQESITKYGIEAASDSSDTSDFSMGVGTSKESENEKKGIPTVVYVLGGVLVVGVIGLVVMNSQKNKRIQQY